MTEQSINPTESPSGIVSDSPSDFGSKSPSIFVIISPSSGPTVVQRQFHPLLRVCYHMRFHLLVLQEHPSSQYSGYQSQTQVLGQVVSITFFQWHYPHLKVVQLLMMWLTIFLQKRQLV